MGAPLSQVHFKSSLSGSLSHTLRRFALMRCTSWESGKHRWVVPPPSAIIINIVVMPLSHQLPILSKLECPQVNASFYLEKLKLSDAVGTFDGLKTKYNYLQQSITRGLSGWRILIICLPWEKLSHARGRTRSLDSRPWSLPSSHFAIVVAD